VRARKKPLSLNLFTEALNQGDPFQLEPPTYQQKEEALNQKEEALSFLPFTVWVWLITTKNIGRSSSPSTSISTTTPTTMGERARAS